MIKFGGADACFKGLGKISYYWQGQQDASFIKLYIVFLGLAATWSEALQSTSGGGRFFTRKEEGNSRLPHGLWHRASCGWELSSGGVSK